MNSMHPSASVAHRTAMMQVQLQEKLRLCFEAQSRTQQCAGRNSRKQSSSAASSEDLGASRPSMGGASDDLQQSFLLGGNENIPPSQCFLQYGQAFDQGDFRREPAALSEVNLNRIEIDTEKCKSRPRNSQQPFHHALNPLNSSMSSIGTQRDGQLVDSISQSGSRFSMAHHQILTTTHDVSRSTDLNRSSQDVTRLRDWPSEQSSMDLTATASTILGDHESLERPLGRQVVANTIWPRFTPANIPSIPLTKTLPEFRPFQPANSQPPQVQNSGKVAPQEIKNYIETPYSASGKSNELVRTGSALSEVTMTPISQEYHDNESMQGCVAQTVERAFKRSTMTQRSYKNDVSGAPPASTTLNSSRRCGVRKPAVPRQSTPQRSRAQHYDDSRNIQVATTLCAYDAPSSAQQRSASADQDRRSSYASSLSQKPSRSGVERRRSTSSYSPSRRALNSARSVGSRNRSICNSSFRDDPARPAFINKSDRKCGDVLWRQPQRQDGVCVHQVQTNWLGSLCEDKKDEDQRNESLSKVSRSRSTSLQRSSLLNDLGGVEESQQALFSARSCRRWLWERPPLDSARSSKAERNNTVT